MKRINFQQFGIYTSVSRKEKVMGDVRENFANLLYTQVNGIRAHTLALKIFQSEGETEYTDEEILLIQKVASEYCLPAFIDGLNEQISSIDHHIDTMKIDKSE